MKWRQRAEASWDPPPPADADRGRLRREAWGRLPSFNLGGWVLSNYHLTLLKSLRSALKIKAARRLQADEPATTQIVENAF